MLEKMSPMSKCRTPQLEEYKSYTHVKKIAHPPFTLPSKK